MPCPPRVSLPPPPPSTPLALTSTPPAPPPLQLRASVHAKTERLRQEHSEALTAARAAARAAAAVAAAAQTAEKQKRLDGELAAHTEAWSAERSMALDALGTAIDAEELCQQEMAAMEGVAGDRYREMREEWAQRESKWRRTQRHDRRKLAMALQAQNALTQALRKRGHALKQLEHAAGDMQQRLTAARAEVKELLKDVDLELVYNMDETGLFYRQLPCSSNVTKKRAGTKLAKDRFMAALTVNATVAVRERLKRATPPVGVTLLSWLLRFIVSFNF